MASFFYWSGVAFWTVITVVVSVLMFGFIRQLFWSAIFVRRLLRAGGWRDDVPRWKRPWKFVTMSFRETLDPTTYMTHRETGKRIYHPLYRGEFGGDEDI